MLRIHFSQSDRRLWSVGLILAQIVGPLLLTPERALARKKDDSLTAQLKRWQAQEVKNITRELSQGLDAYDQTLLYNLALTYGSYQFSDFVVQEQSVRDSRIIRILPKKSTDGSFVEIVEKPQEGSVHVRIHADSKRARFKYLVTPSGITADDLKAYFSRVDPQFHPTQLDPIPPVRWATPEALKKMTPVQRKAYFTALQKVVQSAQEVSLSLKPKSHSSLWPWLMFEVGRLEAQNGPSCVWAGYPGYWDGKTCRVEQSSNSTQRAICGYPARVQCNPMIYGAKAGCAAYDEPGACERKSQWNDVFRYWLDQSGNKNFSQIQGQLSDRIAALVEACQLSAKSGPRGVSQDLNPSAVKLWAWRLTQPWLWGADDRRRPKVKPIPQEEDDAELQPIRRPRPPKPAEPPSGGAVEVLPQPAPNPPATPTPPPVVSSPNPAPMPAPAPVAPEVPSQKPDPIHCQNLENHLRELNRLTCQDLEADLQKEFGCDRSPGIVVGAQASAQASANVVQKDRPIWPWVIGAGLLGFLLGYLLKKRDKKYIVVNQPVLTPVPNPILVPHPSPIPVPLPPVIPSPGPMPLPPAPGPQPSPGPSPNPLPSPSPSPSPVPGPMPPPVRPPYTPPVRGVQ